MNIFSRLVINVHIICLILLVLLMLKLFKLQKTLEVLKLEKRKRRKLAIKEDYIFYLHARYSKIFGLKKCLTNATTLCYLFYRFGYSPIFYIGINNQEKFSSHAWLEFNSKKYFFDDKEKYKKVISI